MELNKKLVGIRIKQRRKECGYTQSELAEKIGVSENHISDMERGKYAPTTNVLLKICSTLGGTPDFYLIGQISAETDELSELIRRMPAESQSLMCKLIKTYLENINDI